MGFVFQISEEDVERSSTLEESDVGKWACIICGCIQILSATNYADANEDYWAIVG